MRTGHGQIGTLWIAAGFAMLLSLPAGAQNRTDRDTMEINSYRLTDAALARFTQAQGNVAQLAKQASSDCAAEDSSDAEDGDNAKSLDQLVAKLDATAGVRAAIQSAGMTTREFVVFSLSVFQAGLADWALGQPGAKLPPGVSMENVTFYRKHQAAMQKLGESAKASECNNDDDGDD